MTGNGALSSGQGVARCVRSGLGTYDLTFGLTSGASTYAVTPAPELADPTGWTVDISNKTAVGLTFLVRTDGAPADAPFSFTAGW